MIAYPHFKHQRIHVEIFMLANTHADLNRELKATNIAKRRAYMYCNIVLGSMFCKTPSIKLSQFPRVAAAPCLSVRLIQYLLPPRHQAAYMPAAREDCGGRSGGDIP